ncbi:uncharacterized protein LOC142356827 [Convolutriloba macropyga]|uniref:uncharacterized protein LOC142356827 n=1 Tax=Convolutriloba macropyga TaxID=536237 RepID=UPI003F51EA39
MDDQLVSLQSWEEAADVKAELIALLAKGGFKLTKWATNFDEDEVQDKALTILGLEWNNKIDTLKVCREDAFCAVAYLVTENDQSERKVSFIIGKTRVAPVKHHTIPKLELMAALTGNRLKDTIMKEHSIHFHKVFMWPDSTTAIQWIRSSNGKQPTFDENRVAEILDTSTVDEWHHVEGAKNPADLGTRGLSFDDIANSNWIKGPDWLLQPIFLNEDNQLPAEQDMNVQVYVANEVIGVVDWKRYSQYNRLRRTIAWILSLARKNSEVHSLLEEGAQLIWKLVQLEVCSKEIDDLKSKKTVSSNSKIVSLSPFIDSTGVLRAKGRLKRTNLTFETKHPVVLPSKHRAVELILSYQHKIFHHEGVEYIRNEVQKKFWIFGLRSALRAVKHNCVTCQLFTSGKTPQMSDLPTDGVTNFVRPFTNTGVDYFGPFEFKEAFQELRKDEIASRLAEESIKWTFNPPAAPHFGGVWERLVKSFKKALYNVLGKQSLTEDRLRTVLCVVEQLMNNRPHTDNKNPRYTADTAVWESMTSEDKYEENVVRNLDKMDLDNKPYHMETNHP